MFRRGACLLWRIVYSKKTRACSSNDHRCITDLVKGRLAAKASIRLRDYQLVDVYLFGEIIKSNVMAIHGARGMRKSRRGR
jgi:hypothetical protein